MAIMQMACLFIDERADEARLMHRLLVECRWDTRPAAIMLDQQLGCGVTRGYQIAARLAGIDAIFIAAIVAEYGRDETERLLVASGWPLLRRIRALSSCTLLV